MLRKVSQLEVEVFHECHEIRAVKICVYCSSPFSDVDGDVEVESINRLRYSRGEHDMNILNSRDK